MKTCLSIKTDYELLSSLIKVPDLISYALKNNYDVLGIIDNNLSSSIEFINTCKINNIKPIIGLDVLYNNQHLYLYARNEKGLKGLFKLNTYLLDNPLSKEELIKYITDLVIIIPYENSGLYKEFIILTNDIFIGYHNDLEKKNALLITNNVLYFNIVLSLTKEDTKYLNYLKMIDDNTNASEYQNTDYSTNYIFSSEYQLFTKLIDLNLSKNENLIPHYDEKIQDSYKYLEALAIKGLNKRLNNILPDNYKKRLLYELSIIKKMGFVDYFLIVYDYVKYAKKNDILVGPGRGSAAGSLVTYSLGITNIDPLKYDLLFERFLNPERVTMPDIDIDFDANKRYLVIDYVKKKYGEYNVLPIITYGTLAAKQALLSVSKILNINIDLISKYIDPKKTLDENLTPAVIKILNSNLKIKQVYYEARKLEGLKKHVSTHAAGIIICNQKLDNIIPIMKSGNTYLTGYTMNYLEGLGLLKMDFLAIKDLTTIANILSNIPEKININNLDLNDQEVLNRFTLASTTGIFQFESEGMKNFLRKLKPTSFNDLIVALALFRPGPMDNIDSFIKRKNGKEKIDYLVPSLEPVLKETYGIIVYQEQIMKIFNIIGGYSVAEADIIRRAISKKHEDVILNEKEKFINKATLNGYLKEDAIKIYDLIMKFANYGFNKSHSVAYALFGYQMMYLKVKYPLYFYTSLLTINIGSASKTKEYIDEAKELNIKILKPDLNLSNTSYVIEDDAIRMPFGVIKNVGEASAVDIVNIRKEGLYTNFFDFIKRTYGKSINTKTIQNLIYAGVFTSFNYNRATLLNNIKNAIIYAELASGLEPSLVAEPEMEIIPELLDTEIMNKELELFGFYVSNHPASKYKGIKIINIKDYFDKNIITYGLLESIKTIKTKNNDTMAFLKISDETGTLDYTLFPNRIDYVNKIKVGDLLKILGHVEKRLDKYQIVINKLEIIKINTNI
jgi:DNA polymerase III subunit alpha